VKGRVTMRFDGLKFRADTHVQDVQLAGVLPAIEHPGFPVDELHWEHVGVGGYHGDVERAIPTF